MNKETFNKELNKLGIVLTANQEKQLEEYRKLLIEKNKTTNLTAITNIESIYLKHFYDSLTIVKAIDLNNQSICDLGTGAGFPGIVLKIVFPNLKITLVDSLNKRVEFLNYVIEALELNDINVISNRIEKFSTENKEKYDILVTRAVARTNIILELGVQALKVNGYFILMKSEVTEELEEASTCIKKLNLMIEQKEIFCLPIEKSIRTIIKLKKIDHTNNNFPRDFAKIKKNSL